MNMFKKLLSSVMAIAMLLSAAPLGEFAGIDLPDFTGIKVFAADEEAPTSGSCGENLEWSFDKETGTLTISGEGEMENYYYSEWNNKIEWDTPWKSYRLSIKKFVIEDGVTSIGEDAFAGCKNLTEFSIPDSVVSIGNGALSGCSGLTKIIIPDTVKEIGYDEIGDQNTLEYLRIPMMEEINDYFEYDKKSASEISISDKELVFKWSKDTQRTIINIGADVTDEVLYSIAYASGYVKEINLDESNKNFKLVDGVLYTSDMSMVLIYPTASDKKTYVMPDTVKNCSGNTAAHWSFFNALYLENLTLGANYMADVMPELLANAFESIEYDFEDLPADTPEEDLELLKLSWLIYFMPSDLSYYTGIDQTNCRNLKTFSVSEDNPYLKEKNGFLCYKADKYDAYLLQIINKGDKAEFTETDLFICLPPIFNTSIDEVSYTNGHIENKVKIANLMLQRDYGYIIDEETEDIKEFLSVYLNSTLGLLFMGVNTKAFNVPEDNKYLTTENGILFTKDKSVLLQYPMASERTFYNLPDVEYISAYAFSSAGEMGYLKNHDLTLHFSKDIVDGKTKILLDSQIISAGDGYMKSVLGSGIEYSIGSFCFESKEDFKAVYGIDYDEYKTEVDEYNKTTYSRLSEYEEDFKNGLINERIYMYYINLYNALWSYRANPVICGGKHNIIKDFAIDEVENTEVKFGESVTLTANLGESGLPEGCKVEWTVDGTGAEITVSEDTLSCTVKCIDSGEVTVTAKVIDAEGNTVTDEYGKDAADSQALTMLGYVPYATITIDEIENTEVKFGESVTLTANLGESGLPEGCKVEWTVDGTGAEITVSEDTLSCTVKCVDSGEVTVTAKVVDAEGNTVTDENGNDATASQVLTMKAGFFARVEAFFKNLWNLIINLFK